MEIGKEELKGKLIYFLRETRSHLEAAGRMTRAFTQEEREKLASFYRVVSGVEDGFILLHQKGLYRK